ncbi:hypothetical protein [Nostoc sp. UHCC 0252]|uniref:hypothetical protein n=1 Tax=Nostoc sp. UHCC 0252 TaxID=3110241 RepID=UPI002B205315|nr:hypothetical protein [Nostoc sp. UHCC 0252]MEA5605182.1 hypothetical protein [Nostoc sp. UHCC 0252]
MKISAILKGSICLLGLVSVGNILAAPASAGQGAARGAVTLVRASGASISVSGELTLPNNAYFAAPLVVAPEYGVGTSATDDETIATLTLTPGDVAGVDADGLVAGSGNAFVQAAAAALVAATDAADIGAQAAIIRAGAGANGLGGLE